MYSLRNYGDMILDEGRTLPYVEALRRAVTPGSVVLDLGTGTGLFALLACRFGARRVFAVEPCDAIEAAREIAAANGFAERIDFFRALSTEIDLPERADVIVAEIHGVLPVFERCLVTLIDARRRFLAPGGVMIPKRETLWGGIVEAHDVYSRLVAPWGHGRLGIDMSAGRRMLTNDLCRADFEARHLLAAPVCGATLDYSRIEQPDVAFDLSLRIERNGTAHGIALWFDATLADGIEFSNAPGKPRLVFGNAFLPWPEPVDVADGDTIEVNVRARFLGERYRWSWGSRVRGAAGDRASFRQSQFFATPFSLADLRRQAASHVPRLNEAGEIERLVLQRMSERLSLGDIARELTARFPARYAQLQDALAHVGELSLRYSD